MKKLTFLACAAMLTSAVVFTGCKNEDEPTKKAPTVTTDVTISLPGQVGGGSAAKRMPGRTIQTSGADDFAVNGMSGITLVPFSQSAKVTEDSKRHGDNIILGTIGTNVATASNGRTTVFENTKVPQGTSAFLFYGQSGATGTPYQTGVLTGTLTGEPKYINFALGSILTNLTDVTEDAAYTGLIAYLNSIITAKDTLYGGKEWRNLEATDNEGYYNMFQTFATTHVLNSYGVQRMMNDLYKSLSLNTVDSLAKAIRKAIKNETYVTVGANDTIILNAAYQNVPKKFGLPDGALAVYYDALTDKVFKGSVSSSSSSAAAAYGGLSTTDLTSYVYPASLWYFANSQIKTSNRSEKEHYTAGASWESILGEYANDNASVSSTTRSIAIKDTIQYAVARLDVRVKTKENTYLEDNDSILTNNHIANPAGGYQITAVLVGGQKNVGFDFTPETYNGSAAGSFTIYDSIMTNTMRTSTGAYSERNSTLVLESEEGDGKDVYVAIELINSSAKDFYGVDGIVPRGAKFYLVGKLTAAGSTVKDANNNTIQRVFIQDYTTTASFSIKDLKNAYSVIPDLRAPSLEIGMSVDLTWQAGTEYTVEL